MNGFFGWFGGLLAAIVPGMGTAPAPSFTGYIDARYVYIAPASAGIIETLAVRDGEVVKKGELLFRLAHAQQDALLAVAVAQVAVAEANRDNLTTGGRAEELAASQAAVNKTEADLKLAQATLQRSQTLFGQSVITEAQLDQDKANLQSAQAALNQAKAQLAVTALPARDALQQAAEASLTAAKADADKARADLADRTVLAPADGRIERTYFDAGETANAGAPVLSLLPADALRVEFYVGEADRTRLAMGQAVTVACDGCAAGLGGEVSFLASDPQYTSPIIFSRDERGQLTYLAEATLPAASGVLPGQPVTVSLGR